LMWGALSDERMGQPFTIAAGPSQSNHSWVRVPRDSYPYVTVSDSRLPQPGGPGPRIYVPQEQGGPVILLGTGFLFVASYDSQGYGGGIRAHLHTGCSSRSDPRTHNAQSTFYVASARTAQKIHLLTVILLHHVPIARTA
jgi:hypothetical protein